MAIIVLAETDGCGIEVMVESFQPNVAILGVRRLNGPNGLDMLRQLREVDGLPVVLLTAFDIVEDRLTGFRLGADGAASKPLLMPGCRRWPPIGPHATTSLPRDLRLPRDALGVV